jgi:hypothetical protein
MTLNASVNVALIHWPVLDRTGQVVCTNVTNFDIHDIARASRVFGVEKYFIVNRMKEQLSFVSRVLEHWRVGTGSKYNPKRKTALGMVQLEETLESTLVAKNWEKKPLVVATSARPVPGIETVTFRDLKGRLEKGLDQPVLLVFGTGFGLHEDILKKADLVLEPIRGASKDDYRHLSVRSAVTICLDRLLGAW